MVKLPITAAIVLLSFIGELRAVNIPTVPVGNPGNPADATGYGSVAYDYRIGTTEVTNSQYVKFLNAKAASDPFKLYHPQMEVAGGIARSGSEGNYSYATVAGGENKPVVWCDWYDAIRFANWLHNGQGAGDTEDGSYTIGELYFEGIPLNMAIARNPGASWFLPSEDEWYKAAYHKNDGATGNYFKYPTSSDSVPDNAVPPGGTNSANYDTNAATAVGAYSTSTSPYGTSDQGANLWEWTEALSNGVFRGIRGGSWNNDSDWMEAASQAFSNPTHTNSIVGFRVATIPEPSTYIMAAIGVVALLFTRRRKR